MQTSSCQRLSRASVEAFLQCLPHNHQPQKRIALITTFALAVGPTPAHAQSQVLKAQIPFAFYVDGHAASLHKVEELWDHHLGILSTQVLQEFYVNITTKIPKPLSKAEARSCVERYFVWPVIRLSTSTIRKAFEIERRNQLSFWDAMIVSAAFQARVTTILSEDLNPGQKISGITIVNPFG